MILKAWDCYIFAIKIGIRSILRRHYLIGLKQMLFPVSYWRFPIFNVVLNNIERDKKIRILDIGSPKLLSLYLAIQCVHTVYATDLQDSDIFMRYNIHFRDYNPDIVENYIVEYQDARSLKYENEYFDVVYSISVLEHIPGNGDIAAMKEIRRVLKNEGKAIIEVPFTKEAKDEYMMQDIYDRSYIGEPVFYQRHYDKNTIRARLIDESKMHVEKIIITEERLPFEKYWSCVPNYLKIPFLWMEAIVSRMNHITRSYENVNGLEKAKYIYNGMNATLVLVKNKF